MLPFWSDGGSTSAGCDGGKLAKKCSKCTREESLALYSTCDPPWQLQTASGLWLETLFLALNGDRIDSIDFIVDDLDDGDV